MRLIMSVLVLLFGFNAVAADFYSITEKDIEGRDFKMSSLKGKAVLIVNIASQCGFTPQLDDLEKLHDRYNKKGVVILGVPSNDFGGQTPEDDKGMKEFCQKKYSVSFPLLSKGTVKGQKTRPLYQFLTQQSGQDFQGEIGWNFVKFLVNREGVVVKRWASMVNPMDESVITAIDQLAK